MDCESDASLLLRIRSGDRQAFADLYERYKRPLYAYCYQVLRDRGRAEDAVHDTFLKLHQGSQELVHPERLRFWLFSVARNEALLSRRRNGHVAATADETVWEEETPLSILAEKERSIILQEMLSQMKVEYREVLQLREYEGLTYSEIAAVTGDSESSVKSRIFKARKALAAKFPPWMKERKG